MTCDVIQKRLSAYLDRQLLAGERTDVEHHLAACADCGADLRSLEQVKKLLCTLPKLTLPEPVRAAIEAETIHRSTWQHDLPVWLIPTLTAAAVGGWLFVHLHKARLPVLSPQQLEATRPPAPESKHDLVAWHPGTSLSKDTQ